MDLDAEQLGLAAFVILQAPDIVVVAACVVWRACKRAAGDGRQNRCGALDAKVSYRACVRRTASYRMRGGLV